LTSNLKEYEFIIYSLLTKPLSKLAYQVPENVKSVLSIPLWGTEYPKEHLKHITVKDLVKLSLETKESDIRERFAPHFKTFIEEIKVGGRNPEALGEALAGMHDFLIRHSFRKTFRSPHIWNIFLEEIMEDELYSNMRVYFLIRVAKIISHVLRILSYPYPEADLYHSSAAAICGLIGVVKKIKSEAPYIVTEHGIYFRERILDVYEDMSIPEKIFWLNIYRAISLVNYYYADKILPVCEFNISWEKEFGISSDKIEKIYNGVDVDRFKPMDVKVEEDIKPIVVMSRVEKLKDILNIIEAMKYVSEEDKKVRCEIYGPIIDEEYFNTCLKRIQRLGISDKVQFLGRTDKPELAYNRAQVVVQPSLSEAFPFTVIEAMACGKPVVATDVGGVKEAVGEAGIIVPPRSPKKLAEGILLLLGDEKLRKELSRIGRERVLKLFTYQKFIEDYRRVYLEIASEHRIGGEL